MQLTRFHLEVCHLGLQISSWQLWLLSEGAVEKRHMLVRMCTHSFFLSLTHAHLRVYSWQRDEVWLHFSFSQDYHLLPRTGYTDTCKANVELALMCYLAALTEARAETVERREEKGWIPIWLGYKYSQWGLCLIKIICSTQSTEANSGCLWHRRGGEDVQVRVCVYVCVCVRERERRRYRETEKRVRQSVHSEKFHPECLQLAGMKPEYFIWFERAQKKTRKKKKKKKNDKKRLRLLNESVCLKVLHFTWLHPSHSLHMGSVAPITRLERRL